MAKTPQNGPAPVSPSVTTVDGKEVEKYGPAHTLGSLKGILREVLEEQLVFQTRENWDLRETHSRWHDRFKILDDRQQKLIDNEQRLLIIIEKLQK